VRDASWGTYYYFIKMDRLVCLSYNLMNGQEPIFFSTHVRTFHYCKYEKQYNMGKFGLAYCLADYRHIVSTRHCTSIDTNKMSA
jgi:hypothetical protein